MDITSTTSMPKGVERPKGWFNATLNALTFGYWNRMTKGERASFFVAWNISSWVTVFQLTVLFSAWEKLTAAHPWVGNSTEAITGSVGAAGKFLWGKFSAGLMAVAEAFDTVV